MLSRARARELCQKELDLDATKATPSTGIAAHSGAAFAPGLDESMRMLFLNPDLAAIKELTNSQLASFLRCRTM